ncbi:peroxidase family protein [Amaricoccus solimangrovi]|uniref:Heme peroxidase n=1 Tax=Amaricoccus solimangrovi TaxID=2589815 RepID=A0A501X0B8_9RHOB|nr:peroxidase family protein [Amaricoccus solimangrovi]TPE53747.1 hypothetical protein FJM51_01495 [Amaricoccus solimangrovi]
MATKSRVGFSSLSVTARENDGSGNNSQGGARFDHYVRVTPNSYGASDGSVWDRPDAEGGANDPRAISDRVLATSQDRPAHEGVNELFQFFGQFITHDIAGSQSGSDERVASLDPHVFGGTFSRDAFVMSDEAPLNANVREQIDSQTAFMDLSQVYGPSDEINALLRDPDSAKLLTGSGGLLPHADDLAAAHGITAAEAAAGTLGAVDFGGGPVGTVGGDARMNQQAQLLADQTIFLRNHNWHVDQLEKLYPGWSTEKVYQTARALNEADFQHVVYDEYLAKLVGKHALSAYSGFDARVDPRIINEWSTVAFRFGHDQASASDAKLAEDGSGTTVGLGDNFTQSFLAGNGITSRADLDLWVRGELAQAAQEIDGKVSDGVRNELFGLGFDLAAVDIARGDDHGVGDYNALRAGLGLSTYSSLGAFARANDVDAATLSALRSVYGSSIGELDSIVGVLLEKEAKGSMLGETATILTVTQFENTRDGDRFWYQERFADHPELIRQIQDTSLADIIARTTGINRLYHDAFVAAERIGGTSASDTLNGTDGADLIIGFNGRDTLSGGAVSDDLYGGDGRDALFGDGGHDMLWGGAAMDTLRGGRHGDTLDGGTGSDLLFGDAGRDTFVFKGGGYDHVADFRWNETIDLSAYSEFQSLADVRDHVTERHGNQTIHLEDGAVILDDYAGHRLHTYNFVFADNTDIV